MLLRKADPLLHAIKSLNLADLEEASKPKGKIQKPENFSPEVRNGGWKMQCRQSYVACSRVSNGKKVNILAPMGKRRNTSYKEAL
jgi:hypothetical protein